MLINNCYDIGFSPEFNGQMLIKFGYAPSQMGYIYIYIYIYIHIFRIKVVPYMVGSWNWKLPVCGKD